MNIPLPQRSLPPDPESRPVLSRLSGSAVASFVLGLLALPLNIFAGLPALLVGYRSLYAINASEGRLGGRPLAVTGMALGVVGCLIGVGFGVFLLFSYLGAASARADCANNLRQMGAALEKYQENHGGLYPAGTIPNRLLAPDQRLSWMASLLPYLERKTLSTEKWTTLVDSIHPDQGWWQSPLHLAVCGTRVPTFLCQGALDPAIQSTPGLTTYIGLAGVGSDAPSLPLSDPRAGFFGYDRTVKRPQLKEGLAYTMVVTETTLNGPWIAGGFATVRGIVPDQAPLIGIGRPLGGCHFAFLTGVPGLNTLWLDGSVRYFTNSMPAETFADQTRLER
jgi:Protein of unknown function (DUF1559)